MLQIAIIVLVAAAAVTLLVAGAWYAGVRSGDRARTRSIAALARAMLDSRRPREDLCRTLLESTRALSVIVVEPDPLRPRWLGVAAEAGAHQGLLLVDAPADPGPLATAYRNNQRVFVADARKDVRQFGALAADGRTRSLLIEPVPDGHGALAMLVLTWDRVVRLRELSWLEMLGPVSAVVVQQARSLDAAHRAARVDALTGLANRRAWDDAVPLEVARARRHRTPLSLIVLDIDHFKRFNDAYGHLAGDRLLRDAAARWRRELRGTDVLARYGGEEFAVLLPDADARRALQVASRLRAVMPRQATCSAGVASWDGRENADELLQRADRALYRAKDLGRDRAVLDSRPAVEPLRTATPPRPQPGMRPAPTPANPTPAVPAAAVARRVEQIFETW